MAMKVYVANGKKKAKRRTNRASKSNPAPRKRANPLALVIAGANPKRRKSMAKSKKKSKPSGNHRKSNPRRAHAKSNSRRRRAARMNPLPVRLEEAGIMVAGAGTGGIVASYGTNMLLGTNDQGLLGFGLNLAITLAGAWALALKFPKFALGWLIGGGTMVLGRGFDALFGKQVITYQWPASAGTGSYYAPTRFPLPFPNNNSIFASQMAAMGPSPAQVTGKALPPGHPANSPASQTGGSAASGAAVGMGWAYPRAA
jgi:hypothetical protein